ncbi:MAG: hypothetical protein LC793_09170 [Thermomicrobia bacterium]|nr:hypothetical protein [Thermomicrobia bacterium]
MSGSQTPPGVPVSSDDGTVPAGGPEDHAPTTLFSGRYRIERVIGQGAFGRVYLAAQYCR